MKKLVSLLLTITMLFSVSTAVLAADMPQQDYPQRFWDVPKDHWAFNYIAELVNKGVLAGYEDGSFRPDTTVTRAEWAKIMVLAAGLPANDNNVYFTDMNNHWANIYVNTAKDYLAAYTDGTFKPDQAAVREDVTVSMVKLKGYDVSNVDYAYLSQFTDVNSISNSLKAYVAVAVEKDLISGFDDGTFRGQNTLTRAEAATLLWRAFQYGNDNKVVDTPDTPVTTPPATTVTTPPTTTTPPAQTEEQQQTPDNTTPDNTVETPEPTEKPYIIDTLKQTKLDGPGSAYGGSKITYDGSKIYYIDGNDIYSLDPYSGDTSIIYNTNNLVLQKTETQEREVTGAVTVESEEPKTEEVIIEEYSDYTPTQIKYDPYNDRLILTGYFKNAEVAFEAPNNNARYFVSYDISNDEVFWEYERYSKPSFLCFISKDKAVCYDGDSNSQYIVNTSIKTEIDKIKSMSLYWNVGNSLYGCNIGSTYYGNAYRLFKHDFSSNNADKIFDFPIYRDYCLGVKGEDLYYWSGGAVFKLNLISGKSSELPINANSEYCDVLDMAGVSVSNAEMEFIPVSDTYFVFYDNSLGAFRTLSER